jgi:hypothetical protein
MRKFLQQSAFWIAFAISVSGCSHVGPDTRLCIVDVKNFGFQCVSQNGNYLLPLADGEDLQCVSPSVFEDLLKNCRNHTLIKYIKCGWNLDAPELVCKNPDDASTFRIPFKATDNFICLSVRDLKRVEERCK